MTDPIRAALEAATRHGCGCDCERCQPGCRAQVAEEIAAFLRALPMMLDRELHLPGMGDEPYPDFDAIAEAVLAAAKEERE
jgi:hypothetical protein